MLCESEKVLIVLLAWDTPTETAAFSDNNFSLFTFFCRRSRNRFACSTPERKRTKVHSFHLKLNNALSGDFWGATDCIGFEYTVYVLHRLRDLYFLICLK